MYRKRFKKGHLEPIFPVFYSRFARSLFHHIFNYFRSKEVVWPYLRQFFFFLIFQQIIIFWSNWPYFDVFLIFRHFCVFGENNTRKREQTLLKPLFWHEMKMFSKNVKKSSRRPPGHSKAKKRLTGTHREGYRVGIGTTPGPPTLSHVRA